MTPAEMDTALNKKSGLFGVTGQYVDRRDVSKAMEEGDKRARLAFNMEVYRLQKYFGAYIAALGQKPDAIVFTAGVGEFGFDTRLAVCEGLTHLGIKIDPKKNALARTKCMVYLVFRIDKAEVLHIFHTFQPLPFGFLKAFKVCPTH